MKFKNDLIFLKSILMNSMHRFAHGVDFVSLVEKHKAASYFAEKMS